MSNEAKKNAEGSDSLDELVLSDYFKWGAKNHPGNPFYAMLVLLFSFAALKNADPKSGIIMALIVNSIIAVMYVSTSISVGKANGRLIEEERQNDNVEPHETTGD